MSHIVEIKKEFRFEAAHFLPNVPLDHKCRRLHGHSYRFEIKLRGTIEPVKGWFSDYKDISDVVKPIVNKYLDHYYLNEVEGLENPTCENLAIWLWGKIYNLLPGLCEITVYETCTAASIYKGEK